MTHLLRTPSENVPCTLVGKGYGGEAEIGALAGSTDKINKKQQKQQQQQQQQSCSFWNEDVIGKLKIPQTSLSR